MAGGLPGGSSAKKRETKAKGVEKKTAKAPVKALKKKVVELKAKVAEKKEAKKVQKEERTERWMVGDGGRAATDGKKFKDDQETIWE